MNKSEIVKEMWLSKDPKRKKMLYEVYSTEIHFSASARFIAQYLNKEMGLDDLIKAKDIEYCRHRCSQNNKEKKALPAIKPKAKAEETKPAETPKTIIWTDPDTIEKPGLFSKHDPRWRRFFEPKS